MSKNEIRIDKTQDYPSLELVINKIKECRGLVFYPHLFIYKWAKDRKLMKRLSKKARINSDRFSSKYFAESVLDVYKYAIKNKENRLGILGKLVDKVKLTKEEKDEVDNK